MRQHSTLDIGCYVDATMRLEDIIPCLLGELTALRLSRVDRKAVRDITSASSIEGYYDTEVAAIDYEDLDVIAQQHVPSWCYWGAHPGDVACLGVWVDESIEYDFDGLRVADLAEVPSGYSGEVLHVNDHGNEFLYVYARGRKRTIWEVV